VIGTEDSLATFENAIQPVPAAALTSAFIRSGMYNEALVFISRGRNGKGNVSGRDVVRHGAIGHARKRGNV
jgi:hypothetical protein